MTRRIIPSSLVAVLLVMCLAAKTGAAHMPDSDLASSWYLADVVVEGREEGYKTENYWEHGTLVVTEVHKGRDRVKVGDRIDVAMMAYSRKPAFSQDPVETNEVVMFLKWNERGDAYRPGRRYLPVPSGIRLIKDDVVYRFQQFDQPGPYRPVRQGPEWIDRSELKSRKTTAEIDKWKPLAPDYWESHAYVYDRAALRKDLGLAGKRAERLAAAIESKDLDDLASFLPVTLGMGTTGYYEDGNGVVSNVPADEKDRPDLKRRVYVRPDYADALAQAAAEAFVKHADRARIAAVLAEHKDKLTRHVRHTLEAALTGK